MEQETRRRGRPPKAPRDQSSKHMLIRVGLKHLTERGYASVGIDEILKDAGVPKGSFYHYFPSKSDFGLELIRAYDAYFRDKLETHFGNMTLSPTERLRSFIQDAEAGMAKHSFRRGCLIGNLGQEMGGLPENYRAEIIRVFQTWQDITAALFAELKVDDPEALAAFFWTGWEGAVLRAKLEHSAKPLNSFAEIFFQLLQQRGTAR